MTVFATGRGRMSGRLLMAPGRAILFGLYPSSCTVRCRYAALAIPRIAKDHLVNVGRSGLGPPVPPWLRSRHSSDARGGRRRGQPGQSRR